MLFDCNKCVAFKNYSGRYDLHYITLFQIQKLEEKNQNFQIDIIKDKEVRFKVKCPICNKYHYYRYTMCELLKRKMILGGCEDLGIAIFYIGEKELVEQRINRVKEINREVNEMF